MDTEERSANGPTHAVILEIRPECQHGEVMERIGKEEVDALWFQVAEESFPSTKAVFDWIDGFREELRKSSALCPVLAVGCARNEEDNTYRNELRDLGAICFEEEGFANRDSMQLWMDEFVSETRSGVSPDKGTTSGISDVPCKAMIFSRQPSHTDEFSENQFSERMKRLGKAEWWELEY